MRRLKDKLKALDNGRIQRQWQKLDSQSGLSTKEKLAKLVILSMKRKTAPDAKQEPEPASAPAPQPQDDEPFLIREFDYSPQAVFGRVRLAEWQQASREALAMLANDERFLQVDPQRLLFFDSETTGLAGGTGTIPFMLGFGFFDAGRFQVKIFLLKDLSREADFLFAVEQFLAEHIFSATVTFNGKAFDFPLLETRFILQQRRMPLLDLPHLDFLFPARIIWKNTYESRKLSYLGEMIMGISRGEDIEASDIPALYFGFLRSNQISVLDPVIEHNALDIVGLAAVVLLAVRYLDDPALANDEGERFGLARLFERFGWLGKAEELYQQVKSGAARTAVLTQAVRRLAVLLKKKKLFHEALALWEQLSEFDDQFAFHELSIHYEHRERNYRQAVAVVERAMTRLDLSERRRTELEKRLQRLQKKLASLEESEETE